MASKDTNYSMSFIIYFEDFTQLLFWCAVTLGNVCIVVEARLRPKVVCF